MNEPMIPESPIAPADDSMKQLRTLVHSCAISLLIITGTIFAYLYRQTTTVRKSTNELFNYIAEFEQSKASEMIANLQVTLDGFRREHPDFNPIYTRYFGTNPPPARPAPPTPEGAAGKVVPAPAPSTK